MHLGLDIFLFMLVTGVKKRDIAHLQVMLLVPTANYSAHTDFERFYHTADYWLHTFTVFLN